ncbi:MAG: hypothetical protein FWC20_02470 [Oscillospiraceae bacterium]|nr:hypothetical protein [Oscillospiraceae bacterium]MCL2278258.1 hypothetical protein [Oscillospiraceae bacterium]
MSIRAIDTQMMVARTTDMVRDASPLLKNPETFQAQLANVGKQEAAQNQSKVQATTESEMDNVRTDEDGSGNGAAGSGGGGQGKKGKEAAQNQDSELRVGRSLDNAFIDITI